MGLNYPQHWMNRITLIPLSALAPLGFGSASTAKLKSTFDRDFRPSPSTSGSFEFQAQEKNTHRVDGDICGNVERDTVGLSELPAVNDFTCSAVEVSNCKFLTHLLRIF